MNEKMNPIYSEYLLFQRERIEPNAVTTKLGAYDRFVSAYNSSQRVCEVFRLAKIPSSFWLVFPEYNITRVQLPTDGTVFQSTSTDEEEVIFDYFAKYPLQAGERVCFDATGFLRPHLLFLLRYLYECGIDSVDLVYSEPVSYQKGSQTLFASRIREIRPIRGYEGQHNYPVVSKGECLVVGCGYDTDMMHAIANFHKQATKAQLFPFPPLRPHMYQENRLRTNECQSAFGRVIEEFFAPSYDPFATAQTLERFVRKNHLSIDNLYLCPLATKPQVLGFGWFYLMSCLDQPVSVIFPMCDAYNQETSIGISEVWRYKLDFALLRRIRGPGALFP